MAAGTEPGVQGLSRGSAPSLLGPQSVENCMCTLHNLCYRLDTEVPTRYRQLEHNARNAYTEKSSTGCFSSKNGRLMVSVCVCPCVCPSAPAESPGSHCLVHPPLCPAGA